MSEIFKKVQQESTVVCARDQAPPYLFDKYILTGYRPKMSWSQCVWSLFYLHNQWLNVWSMLGGLMMATGLFAMFMAQVMLVNAQSSATQLATHTLPFLSIFVSSWLVCPTSASYHLFQPVSMEAWRLLRQLDYMMIMVAGFFLNLALAYYPFYCNHDAFYWSVTLTGVCLLINIVWALTPSFKNNHNTRTLRLLSVSFVSGVLLLPVLHEIVFNPSSVAAMYGSYVLISLVMCGLTWGLHFPERYLPMKLDIWLPSHGLMHVFAAVAHAMEYMFVFAMYQQMLQHNFTCSV